jgi:hypothetical protein
MDKGWWMQVCNASRSRDITELRQASFSVGIMAVSAFSPPLNTRFQSRSPQLMSLSDFVVRDCYHSQRDHLVIAPQASAVEATWGNFCGGPRLEKPGQLQRVDVLQLYHRSCFLDSIYAKRPAEIRISCSRDSGQAKI